MRHSDYFPCWPCNGCGRPLKQPLWWKVSTTHGWPFCAPCWHRQMEAEKAAAVVWASFECRAHGWALDQGVAR